MRKTPLNPLRTCIALAAFLFSSLAYAQFNASLSGTVTDPTGAVIPGATVTLRNTATQALRTATSGDQGTYQFSELPPGDYALNGTAKGFQSTSLDHITLVPLNNAPQHLVNAEDGAAVRDVMIGGRFVMQDREIPGINWPSVATKAREAAVRLTEANATAKGLKMRNRA